jgi:MoaA/NifB/PqqE/SkfB family radical SAM enzyme
MTQEDYVRVARECMRLGAVNFSFQGGEPLLFKELPERIQACCPDRNLISVTTNGTLLTDESLDRLRRAGVDILTVSLDSGLAEEHDRFRGGTGSFEKSLAGVKRALQKGFRVTLGAVVTHDTLRGEGIAALIQLARSLGVVLYLILPVPAGKWSNRRDLLLDEDDLAWIDDLTRRSRFIRTDFQANLGPYGCGAVKEILYLTPYGDVLSCPFIHISLGNVLDESVAAIRARALQNPFFAVYHGKCLASTDTEFIDKYLSKTFDAPQVPIPWHEAFPEE